MWNEDYKDMLCALVDESVDFILVGAYALAAHGFPRATVDIDLWVRPSPDNAEKVYKALARFGAPLGEVSATDFEKEDAVVQIGVAPRRIDFVTGVSGLTYDEASRGAITRDIDGVRVRILSMPDMIRNKLASGRPRDLEDVKTLQRHAGGPPRR
jgi:predicted nucleotidyltransferase